MTRRPRRIHSAAFKAKVALAALKGEKTLAEIAQAFDFRLAHSERPPGACAKKARARAVFDTVLERAKLDPAAFNIPMELPSNETITSAVSIGVTASILSTFAVVAGLEAGLLAGSALRSAGAQFLSHYP